MLNIFPSLIFYNHFPLFTSGNDNIIVVKNKNPNFS